MEKLMVLIVGCGLGCLMFVDGTLFALLDMDRAKRLDER
jgi:hypothetical protein